MKQKGESVETRVASQDELPSLLRAKLPEEVGEFLNAAPDTQPDEFADILEVIHALGMLHGIPPWQLEILRAEKAQERGAFEERIVLISL